METEDGTSMKNADQQMKETKSLYHVKECARMFLDNGRVLDESLKEHFGNKEW